MAVTNTKVKFYRTTASAFASATKEEGALYYLTDVGALFLMESNGSGGLNQIQIGVAIGSSGDSSGDASYYGLKKYTDATVTNVAESSNNGKISVTKNGTASDVAVHGLKSAAYTESSAYATAAQGALADSAVQNGSSGLGISVTKEAGETSIAGPLLSIGINPDYVDGSLGITNKLATKGTVDAAIAALGNALSYVGESTTDPKGASGATVAGHTTWKKGEVVTYNNKEYVLVGTTNIAANWRELGDEGSYALKTVKVEGTGYLTGGGDLTANRTIDITTNVKNKIDGAVQGNTAITGATKCKITYDSKGLVTGGSDLAATDIPSLSTDKITSGTFADARIASASTWNGKYTKPSGGIPFDDLAGALQTKINQIAYKPDRDELVAGTGITIYIHESGNHEGRVDFSLNPNYIDGTLSSTNKLLTASSAANMYWNTL